MTRGIRVVRPQHDPVASVRGFVLRHGCGLLMGLAVAVIASALYLGVHA